MAGEAIVFKIKADFLRCLAHPVRLAVLEYLRKGEASVGEMANRLDVEQSVLSKHLAILRQGGILASRQEKVTVFYSVKDKDVFVVLRPITEIIRKKIKESQTLLAHLVKA